MDVETLRSGSAPTPLANYSQGAAYGDVVFLAGQIASDYRTGVPPEARRAVRLTGGSDIEEQTRYVLHNLAAVADAGGTSLDRVVKAEVFLKDATDFDGMNRVWDEFFTDPPPRTTVIVGGHGLLVPGTLIEIDCWAAARGPVDVKPIGTGDAAPSLSVYSPAQRLGPMIHLAGRMALRPDGSVAPEARIDPAFPFYAEAIDRQTWYILEDLRALAETWGGDLTRDTLHGQIYLRDLRDFDLFEEVWQEVFASLPALTVVQAGDLLAREALVEIELVVVHPEHRDEVRRHELSELWEPVGAPGATQVGPYLFLSGVTAGDAAGPTVTPYRSRPVTRQADAAVDRLDRVLTSIGSDLGHIVKTQAFLRDLEDFHRYDRVWKRRLTQLPPRTAVQSGPQGFLDPEAVLQLGIVAVTA